jgi:hypothetical protein
VSVESVLAATSRFPRPRLWGIGYYRDAAGAVVEVPVSYEDIERDTQAAEASLDSLGLVGAFHAVVAGLCNEEPWLAPFDRAVLRRGGRLSPSEGWSFDAYRIAAFVRRMPVSAVIGLNEEVFRGMAEVGPLSETLGRVPRVLALPGAYERMLEAGLHPYRMLMLGPTVAVECRERSGAHVDGATWSIQSQNGSLTLTSRVPRAAPVDHLDVGIDGAVAHEPCACGRADPRVLIAEPTHRAKEL